MYTICKRFDFSASHVLDGLPEGHPCSRLHGHNYEVFVELSAEEVDERGFVIDYRDLQTIKDWIDQTLDHRDLNAFFKAVSDGQSISPHSRYMNPTAENLARYIFKRIPCLLHMTAFPVKIVCVRVCETPKTWAEWRP